MGNDLRKDKMTKALAVILAALIVLTFFRFFYKLGDEVVHETDEAWYAVNVAEMLESGNWIVPTTYHRVDYGSKPPLKLWMDLILSSLIGISEWSIRLPSAIAGFLSYLILIRRLWKYKSPVAAVIFAAAFPAQWQAFRFHMFRAGDMDAVFGLFFVLAMISLWEMARGKGRMLILGGLWISLGFLVKSAHAGIFVLIGFLYLPMFYKQLSLKRVAAALAVFAVPILIWLALRYPYDGFRYINSIFFGEVSTKTQAANMLTDTYINLFIREKIVWLMTAILVLRGVGYLLTVKERRFDRDLFLWAKQNYLTLLTAFVPVTFYTVVGGENQIYYITLTYFGVLVLAATQGSDVFRMIGVFLEQRGAGEKRRDALFPLQWLFLTGVVGICVLYVCDQMRDYRHAGNAGFSLQQFRSDLRECVEEHKEEVYGRTAYIASDRHRTYGDRGHWEQTFMFYGETIGGFYCVEGGVEGFLADEDSLLVLDGELWEEYADVLTGYVFLEQNTYYILNHDRYY